MKKENNLSMYVTRAYHSLQLPKGSMYNNYISEKQTRSFSAPYSTNCTDGNFISNPFSGGYNYDSCRETVCFYNYVALCIHKDTVQWHHRYLEKV